MTIALQNLAQDLDQEVHASLNTLSTHLSRVEKELDLECSNLRSLISSTDPDVNRQLDSLSSSIQALHVSLNDVRQHLSLAASESRQLNSDFSMQANETPTKSSETSAQEPAEMDAQTARANAQQRHDEQITLSGILRALLMADEPAQRVR